MTKELLRTAKSPQGGSCVSAPLFVFYLLLIFMPSPSSTTTAIIREEGGKLGHSPSLECAFGNGFSFKPVDKAVLVTWEVIGHGLWEELLPRGWGLGPFPPMQSYADQT